MDTYPSFLYGTAWKEDKTASLVELALTQGFRGIDTANQRRHYFEEAVGKGLQAAYGKLELSREDLFLQTKYTYPRGQDYRKPYSDSDSFHKQVIDSFESSLTHLQTDYIDSLVLHGPYGAYGMTEEDKLVWRTMESLGNKVKHLGVSNISVEQLIVLNEFANIKPRFVQNRCFADTQWDKAVRVYCNKNDIIYQGFSLLTANQIALSHPKLAEIAGKHDKTIAQIVFAFCLAKGILPITGTSNATHMQEDLGSGKIVLTDTDINFIENVSILPGVSNFV